MLSRRFGWTLLLLVCALLPLCAEVSVSKFSFHWIHSNADDTSVFFTTYQNTAEPVTTIALQITTEPQEAFGVNYSTNRLGKHNITFLSDQLTNGGSSIPYSLVVTYDGETFNTLDVGTEEDIYRSTVGSISIKRGSNTLFVATLLGTVTLGGNSLTVEDFPAGDYSANLKFEVAVE